MTAINFPDSPSVNDTYAVGGRAWRWTGAVWESVGNPGPSSLTYFNQIVADSTTVYPIGGTDVFTIPSLSVGVWQIVYTQTFRRTGNPSGEMTLQIVAGSATFTSLTPAYLATQPELNSSTWQLNCLINVTSPGSVVLRVINTQGSPITAFNVQGGPGLGYSAIKLS
jgi:hypothetical protein